MGKIQIDFTAMWQGIVDTHNKREISASTYLRVINVLENMIYPDQVGRSVIDYSEFLTAIATVEADTWELARLWERLGKSLASGLIVSASGGAE